MDLQLAGTRVVVTGGSKGIGRACAAAFAAEGSAEIVLVARDPAALESAAGELRAAHPDTAFAAFPADLSQAPDRERLSAAHGDADVLVNNAGAIPGGGLFDLTPGRWEEAWSLKVMGYIHLTRLFLERMKESGRGAIVNVIGMAGRQPRWDYICGSAGNAALIAFTEAVGAKSADWNVRVFGVNPSPTRTERIVAVARARARTTLGDEGRWEEALGRLPFGRLAEPEEVAAVCAMLASPRASYLSGTVLDLDGGGRNR